MIRYILFATVNHKGIPKTFEHEITAPGLLAPQQPKDAGSDAAADASDQ